MGVDDVRLGRAAPPAAAPVARRIGESELSAQLLHPVAETGIVPREQGYP